MNLKRLRELQESLEVYGELDEAEGSYGQTPKAHAAFNDLRVKRENTPSKKFSRKSGGKTASVDRALRHTTSSGGYLQILEKNLLDLMITLLDKE